jgi:hypothetical protein
MRPHPPETGDSPVHKSSANESVPPARSRHPIAMPLRPLFTTFVHPTRHAASPYGSSTYQAVRRRAPGADAATTSFADGLPLNRIVRVLNTEGVPGGFRAAKGWSAATVGRILDNEKCVGRWVWNRSESRRDPRTAGGAGSPKPRPNGLSSRTIRFNLCRRLFGSASASAGRKCSAVGRAERTNAASHGTSAAAIGTSPLTCFPGR